MTTVIVDILVLFYLILGGGILDGNFFLCWWGWKTVFFWFILFLSFIFLGFVYRYCDLCECLAFGRNLGLEWWAGWGWVCVWGMGFLVGWMWVSTLILRFFHWVHFWLSLLIILLLPVIVNPHLTYLFSNCLSLISQHLLRQHTIIDRCSLNRRNALNTIHSR